jgi:hypothetical protein
LDGGRLIDSIFNANCPGCELVGLGGPFMLEVEFSFDTKSGTVAIGKAIYAPNFSSALPN